MRVSRHRPWPLIRFDRAVNTVSLALCSRFCLYPPLEWTLAPCLHQRRLYSPRLTSGCDGFLSLLFYLLSNLWLFLPILHAQARPERFVVATGFGHFMANCFFPFYCCLPVLHSQAIDAPAELSLRNAVQLLQSLGALDEGEELTDLGARLAGISIDPR